MIFHLTLDRAEDSWIVAECPALPGCVSQGKAEKEGLENIKEAVTAWLWAEDQKAVWALKDQQDSAASCRGRVAGWVDWLTSQARSKQSLPRAGWQPIG